MTRSALLVIDVQKIYTQEGLNLYCESSDVTLKNINSLIEHFKQKDEPVIYIRHMHKADGSDAGHMFDFSGTAGDIEFVENSVDAEFSDGLIIDRTQKIINKTRYSSFVGTGLEDYLNEQKIDRVVVSGFMTNFCCESAARDAHDRDFYVDFVLDATGTPGVEGLDQDATRNAVAALLGAGFATILSTQSYLEQ